MEVHADIAQLATSMVLSLTTCGAAGRKLTLVFYITANELSVAAGVPRQAPTFDLLSRRLWLIHTLSTG